MVTLRRRRRSAPAPGSLEAIDEAIDALKPGTEVRRVVPRPGRARRVARHGADVAGAVAIVAGCTILAVWLGLIVGGLGLLLLAHVAEEAEMGELDLDELDDLAAGEGAP